MLVAEQTRADGFEQPWCGFITDASVLTNLCDRLVGDFNSGALGRLDAFGLPKLLLLHELATKIRPIVLASSNGVQRSAGLTQMRPVAMADQNVRRAESWRFMRLVLLGAGLIAGGVSAHSLSVYAQSREVFIGATGGRPGSQLPSRYPEGGQGPNSFEAEAARMVEAAQRYLSAGRLREARRLLETVVERDPDSRIADHARRLLAPIYSADSDRSPTQSILRDGGGPRGNWPPSAQGRSEANGEALRETAAPDAVQAMPPRQTTDSRQLRALQNDFRGGVGDRVFFGDASVELGAKSRVVLAAQAEWLRRHPSLTITIEAHADDQGSREFNQQLAHRRAEVVRTRLIDEGVDAKRLKISLRGRDSPLAVCQDPACAAQNRRVLTVIGPPQQDNAAAQLPGWRANDGSR